jgi:hypothetical protein
MILNLRLRLWAKAFVVDLAAKFLVDVLDVILGLPDLLPGPFFVPGYLVAYAPGGRTIR